MSQGQRQQCGPVHISHEICTWFCCAVPCCGYFCCAVPCCGYVFSSQWFANSFSHILRGFFIVTTGETVRLLQYQWNKTKDIAKTHQCQTTTKHNKNELMLGIYPIPINFNRIPCAPIWRILSKWYGMCMFPFLPPNLLVLILMAPIGIRWPFIKYVYFSMPHKPLLERGWKDSFLEEMSCDRLSCRWHN